MSTTVTAGQAKLVESLDNDVCPYCEAGALEPDTYKGDPAVVCDTCDTPVVRLSD